jgi:hypothetical protein
MNMAIRKVFTPNGVGLPFYVQGLPGPLAWSRIVPRFFILINPLLDSVYGPDD